MAPIAFPPAGALRDRRPRRLFVVLSNALAGYDEASQTPCEVTRRLALHSDLKCIPVVIRSDGVLLALGPEQVTQFSKSPGADLNNKSAVNIGRRVSWVTTGLRYSARLFLGFIPRSLREDVRAILIHTREIVRTVAYGGPAARASQANRQAASAVDILGEVRTVAYPRPGDVLLVVSTYGDSSRLRMIGELRARYGIRVITVDFFGECQDDHGLKPKTFDLPTIYAINLIDASDLVLTASERIEDWLRCLASRFHRTPAAVEVLRIDAEPLGQVAGNPGLWSKAIYPALWDKYCLSVKCRLELFLENGTAE